MTPDVAEAGCLLRLLGLQHTFQTFDDSRTKDRRLSRILHGTLAQHADELASLNAQGAGVFVTVNETDGEGRSAKNVTRIRSLFVDLDGAPLAPIRAAPLCAHVVVESSPGRFHAYWRVAECGLHEFTPLQKALAARFNGDPKVHDLCRVMRLPGFDHRKGAPFRTRIVELDDAPPYTLAQMRAAFDVPAVVVPIARAQATCTVAEPHRKLAATIPEGERNDTLFQSACGFARMGHDAEAVGRRIHRINAERCQPPLSPCEVETIAQRAVGYGSSLFTVLPHSLLDSPQWKAVPPAVHDVVVMAFRRYNSHNNGNIALTAEDFAGRKGFAGKKTYYSHRNAAVSAGFLLLVKEGRNTQQGRGPDLFAIAPQWLPTFASSQKETPRKVSKGNPYIDKQLLANKGLEGHDAPRESVQGGGMRA
jgi:hypothetical protein